jgi:hypothetical protein
MYELAQDNGLKTGFYGDGDEPSSSMETGNQWSYEQPQILRK